MTKLASGRPAPAIGAVQRLVGHHALARAPEVGHAIGRAEVVHGVEGEAFALDRVGAHVGEERVLHRHDGPVALEAHPRLVHLVAVVAARHQIFAASRDPLHRPARLDGGRRHQHLLGIDRALGAEAAAHVGHHHADLLRGHLEHGGQRIAEGIRILGGGPDGERARVRVAIGEGTARLEGRAGNARVPDPLAHHHVALGPPLLHVAEVRAHGQGGVVGPFVDRGLRRHRGFRVGRHGQRLVFDLDGLRAVRGGVGAIGKHDSHALAHVAHALVGEHGHLEGAALVAAAVGRGHGALDLGQVGRGRTPQPRRARPGPPPRRS